MPDPEVTAEAATLRLINQEIRERLVVQRDAIERIETKGTILVGFAAAAAQFLIRADHVAEGWQIAGVVAYGIAILAGIVVIVPYRHDFPPNPSTFYDEFLEVPAHLVDKALASERTLAFAKNAQWAFAKEVAWWVTVVALAAGVGFSAASLW